MFSALKKLTKNDDRCPAPVPMSSSLQKKFSRGVHFNMKILIKGDRNVGKSCLLQRLQGGPFIENYVPTEQIQVAPIHWTYKNSDHIVKVEVWEVVDKGRAKKKPPLGLKLENQAAPALEDSCDTPVLDATFLDVYKNANGVILLMDITKPWTFDYVVKELGQVPADLPVVILGNHCDMQHHRQVHPHHIDQALYQAKISRTAPVRYAESSMRNGFGLRLLHKFLNIPFLRLQRTSLLEQLQRNQKDIEEADKELDDFQSSEEAHYNSFVDRLADKRRATQEVRPNLDRSPSIVLGAGKPIVPPNVNPLVGQSLNPKGIKAQHSVETSVPQQTQYVSPELLKPKHVVSMDVTPQKPSSFDCLPSPVDNTMMSTSSGALDEFYAGTLDSSFLDDLTPLNNTSVDVNYDSESDDPESVNPMVTIEQDDLDIENTLTSDTYKTYEISTNKSNILREDQLKIEQSTVSKHLMKKLSINSENSFKSEDLKNEINLDNEFPLWAGDSSARRSPEGGEDPDVAKEAEAKTEKRHKKKKSKDKDRGDVGDTTERKEKKHKHKKSKEKTNPQQSLLCRDDIDETFPGDYDSL